MYFVRFMNNSTEITAIVVLFYDNYVFLTKNLLKLNFLDDNNIFSILITYKKKKNINYYRI